jgi:hypothetical protein
MPMGVILTHLYVISDFEYELSFLMAISSDESNLAINVQ